MQVPVFCFSSSCRIALPEHLGMYGGNNFFTAKLLRQGYRYHKLCKAFSTSYRGHVELIEIYHVSMKKLLQQGILIYKFKKIIGNPSPLILSNVLLTVSKRMV